MPEYTQCNLLQHTSSAFIANSGILFQSVPSLMQIKLIQSIVHMHAMLPDYLGSPPTAISHCFPGVCYRTAYLCALPCSCVMLTKCLLLFKNWRGSRICPFAPGFEYISIAVILLQKPKFMPWASAWRPAEMLNLMAIREEAWLQVALVTSHHNEDLFVVIAKQMSMGGSQPECQPVPDKEQTAHERTMR